jgi:hypothetical protein
MALFVKAGSLNWVAVFLETFLAFGGEGDLPLPLLFGPKDPFPFAFRLTYATSGISYAG